VKNNESLSIKFENIVSELGKELYSYVKIRNPILLKKSSNDEQEIMFHSIYVLLILKFLDWPPI
jgi:hypothetical protein